MSLPHIQSLFELASERERAGAWEAALRIYDDAYALSLRTRDAEGLSETIIRVGHCCRLAGQRVRAAESLELGLVIAQARGDDLTAARALNGLGLLCQGSGDIDGAEARFMRARVLAERAHDLRRIGEIDQNRGILANIRGDLDEALACYRSGLEYLRRAHDDVGTVSALNNLGILHVGMGRLADADGYFQEALALSDSLHNVVLTGSIHINRAELFLAQGKPDRARESCDLGFEIFSRLNDAMRRAEALKFYGIIYRETGKLHLAAIHLREAVEAVAGKDPWLEAQVQRQLGLVLRGQGRNRDAMEALNRAHALFSALQAAPDHADISDRIAQLEADFLALVQVWGESIEAKDRYTRGHCQRVADYACRIAVESGTPEREMVWFRMGAFLHDLGKTEVPEEILNKPGRLSDEERRIMERHTVIGDEMLAPVEFPWDVRPMVRSHHERWDGGGYPDRLLGEAIPRAARILRIADVFDALTTSRSYRRPLSPDEAMRIMEDDAGSFDPELFVLFRRLFPEMAKVAVHAQSSWAEPGAEGG